MSWEPLYGEEKQPKKINTLSNTIMYKLAGTSTGEIEQIFSNWELIIGEKLAEYSRPTHIKNNCLYIQADDSVIAKELQWRSKEVIEQTNKLVSNTLIEETKISSKKQK